VSRQIFVTLGKLQLEPRLEQATPDGRFTVDIVLPPGSDGWREEGAAHSSAGAAAAGGEETGEGGEGDELYGRGAIAIEADGPSHYTATRPLRRLGNTALRDRLLSRRGYRRLICVPFWEWHGLDHKEQIAYVKELLTRRPPALLPDGACVPEVGLGRRIDGASGPV